MTELKPCPFCGSTDLSTSWYHNRLSGQESQCFWAIGCSRCSATITVRIKKDDRMIDDPDLPTMKEGVQIARGRWNKRVGE